MRGVIMMRKGFRSWRAARSGPDGQLPGLCEKIV